MAVAVEVLAGQAVLTSPAVAGASETGSLTVDIDGTTVGAAPQAWVGDADASITVRVTNTSTARDLGSADVAVPAPFRLVDAADDTIPGGPTIELRDLGLAPGA
ncbi:MAG: hypothetical protein MUF83_16405 [Acidimicrobiales bacterium]|jgi:hypothetical protein|nr:hypothetical protein [Acidimicrobiales bacterium]